MLGNIVRADYFDGTWDTFGYNKNGDLIEAANQDTTLKFERDQSGQIIREWQDGNWVASEYDELGIRTRISSSLGAKIEVERNQMGQASRVAARQNGSSAWIAQMQYNGLGQEIERMLPGDIVSHWQHDVTGKPTAHRIQNSQRDTRRHSYAWGINDQLRKMTNELAGSRIHYSYDEFSNLVGSGNKDGSVSVHRSADNVGNLYEEQDKSDRIYGAGSRLEKSGVNTKELRSPQYGGKGKLVTKGTEFTYDDEGNLIGKTSAIGDAWRYEYFGNGMLSKVILPDDSEVTFKYDPLGRRIWKKTSESEKTFVWDGNNPLHELENGELVTWVFDDGFVPTAKITGDGHFSIISDYLGTPVEAYDADGNLVWAVDLDIYGRVSALKGDVDFIPFRYQGQYDIMVLGNWTWKLKILME